MLHRSALRNQWTLESSIDWRADLVAPKWLSRQIYVDTVSQLYHAERLTHNVCQQISGQLDSLEARRFLTTQIADEERHARVYLEYLRRLGDMKRMNEGLAAVREGARCWRGSPYGLMVAFHVVLEGEAVGIQRSLTDFLPCPLLRQINSRIARDEARHVAFGTRFLRHALSSLPKDERRAIYNWVKALWHQCIGANTQTRRTSMSHFVRLGKRRIDRRWLRHERAFHAIGLLDENA